MTFRPCSVHSRCPPDCPEVSSPFGNASSENPDPVDVIAIAFYRNNPGINFNNGSWTNVSDVGVGRAISRGNPVIDKQIADQGALRDVQGGIWSGQQRGIGPPPTAYGNSPQTTTIDCPGGGSFDYTIPPGTYLGQSQEEADELAASYLEEQAFDNILCIDSSEIADSCINQAYSASLTASGGSAPYEWNVTDGSLPTGLTLDPFSGSISGTPTAAGSYTFTITVSDQVFNSQSKQFTISVFQISTTTLPSGIVGTAYSKTVSFSPALGALTISGSLPPGLSLSGSTISGTPTLKGMYNFSLQVEYGELICTQAVSIRIWAPANVNTSFTASPDGFSHVIGTFGPGLFEVVYTGGGFSDATNGGGWFATSGGGTGTCADILPIVLTTIGPLKGVVLFPNPAGNDWTQVVAPTLALNPVAAAVDINSATVISYSWPNYALGSVCGFPYLLFGGGTGPVFNIHQIGQP